MNSKEVIATYLVAMLSMHFALRIGKRGISRVFSRNFATLKSSKLELDPSEEYLARIETHQSKVVKLPIAEEVKTLVTYSDGFGVLSTNSLSHPGYPTGSVVGYQLDEQGKPFFVLSTLAAHTKELSADSRSSLVITAPGFKGANDARVTIVGDVVPIAADNTAQRESLRLQYLEKHPSAYWIEFG